jgi:hypothetical protein
MIDFFKRIIEQFSIFMQKDGAERLVSGPNAERWDQVRMDTASHLTHILVSGKIALLWRSTLRRACQWQNSLERKGLIT